MMLGYATSSASGTYRLLNLETNHVFKSRNVKWLDMTYGEYIRKTKSNGDSINDDNSVTDTDSDDNTNQGVKMPSPSPTAPALTPSARPSTNSEGSVHATTPPLPISSRTHSKTACAAIGQQTETLEELGSLFLSEKQRVIADGLLQSPNDIAHCLMALVGGTDTSKEVPLTF